MFDLGHHNSFATTQENELVPTILTPCRVPWTISPSTSGVTLSHAESDVQPECSVVFGGGRLTQDGRIDSRRIEITFTMCYHARLGPHHDSETIESIGYQIDEIDNVQTEDEYEQYKQKWMVSGICPDSGFYIAKESEWLPTLPAFFRTGFEHYVIDGRDGYVELVERQFAWQEWMWSNGHRDDAPKIGPVVGNGDNVA